jgi:DNA-binding CsgD family transcriptional regulator
MATSRLALEPVKCRVQPEAVGEIEPLREQVRGALDQAGSLLDSGTARAQDWFAAAACLRDRCVRLGRAVDVLDESAWRDGEHSRLVWTESMVDELIVARRDGLANQEIASRLGVSLTQLNAKIGSLIRQGLLASRSGLLWSHPDSWVAGRELRPQHVAPEVEGLYRQGHSHSEIAAQLGLTRAQVHNILTKLFAAGLAKRPRRTLSDQQVRAIHRLYLAGASIDELATKVGFTSSAVRLRMRKLKLATRRPADEASAGNTSSMVRLSVSENGS